MFIIVTVREVLSVKPQEVNKVAAALKMRLEELHVGRVLRGAGLVVRVDSLKAMGDGLVDNNCHIPVIADLIVFRPFVGQVLDGQIVSSDAQGIKVSLGFFDNVHVPVKLLPQPAGYNQGEPSPWYWDYEGNALYLEHGARVRVKVTSVEFDPEKPVMKIEASMATEGLGLLSWWE